MNYSHGYGKEDHTEAWAIAMTTSFCGVPFLLIIVIELIAAFFGITMSELPSFFQLWLGGLTVIPAVLCVPLLAAIVHDFEPEAGSVKAWVAIGLLFAIFWIMIILLWFANGNTIVLHVS